jgi:hypothetical protein
MKPRFKRGYLKIIIWVGIVAVTMVPTIVIIVLLRSGMPVGGWAGAVLIGATLLLIAVAYRLPWSGMGPRITKTTVTHEYDAKADRPTKRTVTEEREGQRTMWDWSVLLLAPLAAATVALFGAFHQTALAQDTLVQEYLDAMGTVLLDHPVGQPQGDETESRASAYSTGRTLTILQGLDAERKGAIMRFVQKAQLINKDHPVVDLSGADLSEANLSNMDLSTTDLSGAVLTNANLSHANLRDADLVGTDLSGANLTGARGVTNEGLEQQATSLADATMPNGQKYEDWLKSKGSGENGGPS